MRDLDDSHFHSTQPASTKMMTSFASTAATPKSTAGHHRSRWAARDRGDGEAEREGVGHRRAQREPRARCDGERDREPWSSAELHGQRARGQRSEQDAEDADEDERPDQPVAAAGRVDEPGQPGEQGALQAIARSVEERRDLRRVEGIAGDGVVLLAVQAESVGQLHLRKILVEHRSRWTLRARLDEVQRVAARALDIEEDPHGDDERPEQGPLRDLTPVEARLRSLSHL